MKRLKESQKAFVEAHVAFALSVAKTVVPPSDYRFSCAESSAYLALIEAVKLPKSKRHKGYLRSMIRGRILDCLRTWKPQGFKQQKYDRVAYQLSACDEVSEFMFECYDSPNEYVESEAIENILAHVSHEKYRDVLRDRYWLGMEYSEIAEKHGLTIRTARTYVNLAKLEIREKMGFHESGQSKV